MPARCTTWTAQISWQQALTLLLEQECRHYHGAIVAQSPAFQSWIWWVRDRFNGLDTALPAECLECPYLSDFKIALWDNLSAPEPQPLLLRKSEFFMNIDLLAGEHDASSQPFNSLGQ
jgi:hypothetical protein